jgi:hypothetical protein
MPKKRRGDGPQRDTADSTGPERPTSGGGREPEPHEEGPGAVRVHQAYLEHRLGGGERATPEAYRRAVEQFQRLPGAMRSVPPVALPDERPAAPEKPDAPGSAGADDTADGGGDEGASQ